MYILSLYDNHEYYLTENVVVMPISKDTLFSKETRFIYNKFKSMLNSKNNFDFILFFMKYMTKYMGKQILNKISSLQLDVIQAEQELAGSILANNKDLFSIPIFYDIHGIWQEELVANNKIKYNSNKYKNIIQLEEFIINSMTSVFVVSEEMKTYVTNNYLINNKNIYVIPNAAFSRISDRSFEKFASKVCYAGSVTYREDMNLLLKSYQYIGSNRQNTQFYLSNKGDALKDVKSYANKLNLKLDYFWFENFDEFYPFLSKCHVGTIPALKHRWRQMATPAKLYDYLSVGVPVISVDIGSSWCDIIKKNDVGLLTSNDPIEFGDAVIYLLDNPDLIYKFGNNAIKLVKTKLNYKNSAENLIKIYKKL